MGGAVFQGLSAFPLTPADANGRVDTEALGRLLERLVAAGVDSIGLLGSTGIYAYIEHAERRRAVAAATEAVAGRTPLMVGIGALRTDWAQDLARDAGARGADALLLPAMAYTPPTEEEIFAHFQAVAEVCEAPICVYNNPTTTHVALSDTLIGRLSRLPGVAAVKMPLRPAGDYDGEIARLRAAAAPGFRVGYSGDWGAPRALLAGADVWFSVVAGLLPGPALRLARAAQAGREDEVAALDQAFAPLWALFQAHGSLRVMYAAARLLGLSAGDPPRPLLPIPAAAQDALAAALDRLA
jgi:4-hydroxy-tetrahydrodipicolinate synthase